MTRMSTLSTRMARSWSTNVRQPTLSHGTAPGRHRLSWRPWVVRACIACGRLITDNDLARSLRLRAGAYILRSECQCKGLGGVWCTSLYLTCYTLYNHRNTSLHFAAWQERDKSVSIIELLLRNHADPNEHANDGSTPLHHAGIMQYTCAVNGISHCQHKAPSPLPSSC